MSDITGKAELRKTRIFYSNITYGCDSHCVFCYSHNTWHQGLSHNEIEIDSFIDYLHDNNICVQDRVIVNGGEPLLHSRLEEIFEQLNQIGCEVLVYTNGRSLKKLNMKSVSSMFRFVVPIHGFCELHDKIVGVKNSYYETIDGLQHVVEYNKCKIDIKIIINGKIIEDEKFFKKTIESLDKVPFNGAVHITKMADTIISKKNNLKSIDEDVASYYTKELFEYFLGARRIKIFDTCIKSLEKYLQNDIEVRRLPEKVLFKDYNQDFILNLKKQVLNCANRCKWSTICQSAKDEYTVLEFEGNDIYIELE